MSPCPSPVCCPSRLPMQIQRFLQRLPRDIFYVLRAVNMVRGINYALGGSSTDRFHTFAQCAVQGLRLEATADAAAEEAAAQAVKADQEARRAAGDAGTAVQSQELSQREAERQADQMRELKLERSVQGSGNQLEGILDPEDKQPTAAADGKAAGDAAAPDDGILASWRNWLAENAVYKVIMAMIHWRRQVAARMPVHEPLTYANALARGSVVSAPTDSELSAAAEAAQREQNFVGYLAHRLGNFVGHTVDMLRVKAVLTVYGLLWKLFLAFGPGVKLYTDPKRANTVRDPG